MAIHESVLIIDDEVEICILLAGILKQKRMKATLAHSIADGYKKLSLNPEILFLDINLPDGSGLDLLKKVRKEQPELKIIIMSAYDGENEKNDAKQYGADAFIGKPFSKDVVFQTIEDLTVKT